MPHRPEAFAAKGRFYRGNLHTHSTLSDGVLPPAEVCRRYAAEGYDFLCLSDHFVGLYDYPIADTSGFRTDTFTTILGAEVHSGQLANGEIWHLLAVGLPSDFTPPVAPDFDPGKAPEPAPHLARRCRDAGAYVALVHPQWFNQTLADAMTVDAAHAVEIYNHGCHIDCERGDGFAILDLLLSAGRRLNICASDDAHFKGPDHFGGWTMVKSERLDPDALVAALKAGHSYASQGPLLHDIVIAGDQVQIQCSPAERIMAVGAGAAAIQTHGRSMAGCTLDITRFRKGGWFRVIVADGADRKAWSNPIWLG